MLAQDYGATRCVVVDDASTDGSAEKIAQRYGDRVTLLVNSHNQEKSSCRNRGVRESQAEFVCFLDSDDLLTASSVTDRMRVFEQNPDFHGVAFGARSNEGRESSPSSMPDILSLADYLDGFRELHTNSFMLRRTTMLQHGMYNEGLTNREDIELFIRLLAAREFRSCGSVVCVCRGGASVRARDNWEKIIKQGTAMTDALAEHQELIPTLSKHYPRLRADEYQELLRALFRSGSYQQYGRVYRAGRREGALPFSAKAFRRYCVSKVMKP